MPYFAFAVDRGCRVAMAVLPEEFVQ